MLPTEWAGIARAASLFWRGNAKRLDELLRRSFKTSRSQKGNDYNFQGLRLIPLGPPAFLTIRSRLGSLILAVLPRRGSGLSAEKSMEILRIRKPTIIRHLTDWKIGLHQQLAGALQSQGIA